MLLILTLLNSTVFFPVSAKIDKYTDDKSTDNESTYAPPSILREPIVWFGYTLAGLFVIIQPFVVSVGAEPSFIEIGYNETVTVEVGFKDLQTGGFKIVDKKPPFITSRNINFEVQEFPTINYNDSWSVQFSPREVSMEKGAILKSNMSITLTSPPVADNAIQSGILKVNLLDYWSYGNLWWPGDDRPFINKFFWFTSAIMNQFGKYSGSNDLEEHEVDILIKVKPYHALKIDAIPLLELTPGKIVTAPVNLENLGNYNDTFRFTVTGKNGNIKISNPFSITLAPGERKETYLPISIPPSLLETGELNELRIKAYSIHQPNVTIAERTVLVEIKGVSVSEESIGPLFFRVIIALVILYLIYFFIKKFYPKLGIRIRKPKRKKLKKDKKTISKIKHKIKLPEKKKIKFDINLKEKFKKIKESDKKISIKKYNFNKQKEKTVTKERNRKLQSINRVLKDQEKQRKKIG